MEGEFVFGNMIGVGTFYQMMNSNAGIDCFAKETCQANKLGVHKVKRFLGIEIQKGIQDWEVTEFQRLSPFLHRLVNLVDNPDAWCWGSKNNGAFSKYNGMFSEVLL